MKWKHNKTTQNNTPNTKHSPCSLTCQQKAVTVAHQSQKNKTKTVPNATLFSSAPFNTINSPLQILNTIFQMHKQTNMYHTQINWNFTQNLNEATVWKKILKLRRIEWKSYRIESRIGFVFGFDFFSSSSDCSLDRFCIIWCGAGVVSLFPWLNRKHV